MRSMRENGNVKINNPRDAAHTVNQRPRINLMIHEIILRTVFAIIQYI